MTAHVCGAFTGKKLTACCCCCGTPTYDILETIVDGPRAGEAGRVGMMQAHGTQVEIQLSDGSVCHIDFCVDCATNLRPEDLLAVWEMNVARTDELCRLAGRRENQRRALVRDVARVFPVGVTRWRRQDREKVGLVPDGLVVDRRRPHALAAPASLMENISALGAAEGEASSEVGSIPPADAVAQPGGDHAPATPDGNAR